MGKRARRGRGRARPGGAPRGGHARGGGGGTRERDGEAWGVEPPAVDDRLGARSSAMTKTTTQPAVRAEGRSPRRARSPPAWRIETSLRRKRVRGGGSRRACGAKGVRGGGSRRACGAPVCLRQEGAAGAGGATEPSSTSIPIEGVTLLPFRSHSDHVSRLGPTADLREPSHAGRRPPHNFWRRFQKAFVRWGATATSFGI